MKFLEIDSGGNVIGVYARPQRNSDGSLRTVSAPAEDERLVAYRAEKNARLQARIEQIVTRPAKQGEAR